jgi:hypothetical protein
MPVMPFMLVNVMLETFANNSTFCEIYIFVKILNFASKHIQFCKNLQLKEKQVGAAPVLSAVI